MSKWSGRGIPPTRRKLHRLRKQQILEAKAERKAERAESSSLEASYRNTRKAILNPERFDELWCQ